MILQSSVPPAPRAFGRFRFVILIFAALEFAPAGWVLLQMYLNTADWSRPYAYESLWIPGLLGAPALLALLLAAFGRALDLAAVVCVIYALMLLFFLSLA